MIEELQALDEKKKKQILIVATIIIMAIIIGIWITYLNSIVAGPSEQAAAQASSTAVAAGAPAPAAPAPSAAPAQASGPSVWQNIGHWFGSVFSSFVNIFQKPSQYTIQPHGN